MSYLEPTHPQAYAGPAFGDTLRITTGHGGTNDRFAVIDPQAVLRDGHLNPLPGRPLLPRWSQVVELSRVSSGGKTYLQVGKGDGKSLGFTALANLYPLSWRPQDHVAEYRAVSSAYLAQMSAIDPVATRARLVKSGFGVRAAIDPLYPNSTGLASLADGFRQKVDGLIRGMGSNGIRGTVNAALRHPLRSVVFNYAIAVAAANSEDIVQEANLVALRYGIPVDWLHTKNGKIDLATCKQKAREVKSEFGLGTNAARGIIDFGGSISNHNSGKAVDITITCNFTQPKTIKVGGKAYVIDPRKQSASTITNVINDGLSRYGKEQFGITRAVDTDPVHWSETGR